MVVTNPWSIILIATKVTTMFESIGNSHNVSSLDSPPRKPNLTLGENVMKCIVMLKNSLRDPITIYMDLIGLNLHQTYGVHVITTPSSLH